MNPIGSSFRNSIVDVMGNGGLIGGISSSSSVRSALCAIYGHVVDIIVLSRLSLPLSSTSLLRHSAVVQSLEEKRMAVQHALRLQQQALSYCSKELREDVFLCQNLQGQLRKYQQHLEETKRVSCL